MSPLPPLPWVPLALLTRPHHLAKWSQHPTSLAPRAIPGVSRLVDAPRSLCKNTLMESRTDRAGVARSFPWKVRAPLDSIASSRGAPHTRPTQTSGYRVAHVYDIRFVLPRFCGRGAPPQWCTPHSMIPSHRLHRIRHVQRAEQARSTASEIARGIKARANGSRPLSLSLCGAMLPTSKGMFP